MGVLTIEEQGEREPKVCRGTGNYNQPVITELQNVFRWQLELIKRTKCRDIGVPNKVTSECIFM